MARSASSRTKGTIRSRVTTRPTGSIAALVTTPATAGEETTWCSAAKSDDELLGDNGVDLLRGGPGRDAMNGGRGDDVFIVANVCEAVPGEHIDGGQGFDTLRTTLSPAQLDELGVELVSIESIVPLDESDGEPECEIPAPRASATPVEIPVNACVACWRRQPPWCAAG